MNLGDATLAAAVIAAVTSVVIAIIASHNNHKLQEIHILVNSRLTSALAEIEKLKKELGSPKPPGSDID